MTDPLESGMDFYTGFSVYEIAYEKPTELIPASVEWAHTERRGECMKVNCHIFVGDVHCVMYIN